jgi:hypothetical protein
MNVAYENLLPGFSDKKLPENPSLKLELASTVNKLKLPVPKGKTSSPLTAKYSDRKFKIDENPFGIKELGFGLFADAGVLRISKNGEYKKISFGWEEWKINNNLIKNPFPISYRTEAISKIAATATWLNNSTLQINLKFIEAVHGDKITATFDDNKIKISLLSSFNEKSKNASDERAILTGPLM